MQFPMTTIGGLKLSRMLCGSNPFMGISHFTHARSTWLKRYFTLDRIVECMEKCASYGINGIVSGPRQEIHDAIRALEDRTGHHMIWVCTPGGSTPDEVKKDMEWMAERKAEICLTHPSFTDSNLVRAENKITGLEPLLKMMRDLGMVPGVSTHRPETLTVCEKAGYDIETYILPLNVAGFLCAVETDWQAKIIRNTPKPVICIKPLAAGRLMPFEGLNYVYNSIKPIDTVAVGFTSPEEVEEDIKIILGILAGGRAEVPLAESRSKQVVR